MIAKDKEKSQQLDSVTQSLIKNLEGMKQVDRAYEESGYRQNFERIQYVEREEDPELKAMFNKEVQEVRDMSESLKSKVDGIIDMDLHGNMKVHSTPKEGITEAGTYVLRDGKLVPGKGAVKE